MTLCGAIRVCACGAPAAANRALAIKAEKPTKRMRATMPDIATRRGRPGRRYNRVPAQWLLANQLMDNAHNRQELSPVSGF